MAEPPQSEVAPEEPTRPETVRQPPTFPQSQSMDQVQPAANLYNEAAQEHMQKQWEARQKPEAEAQQPGKTSDEQVREQANKEIAERLAASSFSRGLELDRER